MQQQISDDALFPIARQMTRWRSIDLGLKKGTVNSIENDPTTKEEEKQVKLLERWRESYGHDATYERLAFSFCSSNRVDLADTACEMRKKARAGSECGECGSYILRSAFVSLFFLAAYNSTVNTHTQHTR